MKIMETKILEIRDRGTYLPVMATKMYSDNEIEWHYLRDQGYPMDGSLIVVCKLTGCKSHYDKYKWDSTSRTMIIAHGFIEENYDSLKSGDVVDVEYILGETKTKKRPQREEYYA
jgi:hypothetical protein